MGADVWWEGANVWSHIQATATSARRLRCTHAAGGPAQGDPPRRRARHGCLYGRQRDSRLPTLLRHALTLLHLVSIFTTSSARLRDRLVHSANANTVRTRPGLQFGLPSALLYLYVTGLPSYALTRKAHTHTHTHPFNGPFSGTTRVSRYQKGKTNLDYTEARDSDWQWHQLGHMQVCTSLQTTTPAPHHAVFTGRMPFPPPNQKRQSTYM